MTASKSVSLLIVGLVTLTLASPLPRPESKLHFIEYCQYFDYPVEEHSATTDDGYVLKIFRIQAKHTQKMRSVKIIINKRDYQLYSYNTVSLTAVIHSSSMTRTKV